MNKEQKDNLARAVIAHKHTARAKELAIKWNTLIKSITNFAFVQLKTRASEIPQGVIMETDQIHFCNHLGYNLHMRFNDFPVNSAYFEMLNYSFWYDKVKAEKYGLVEERIRVPFILSDSKHCPTIVGDIYYDQYDTLKDEFSALRDEISNDMEVLSSMLKMYKSVNKLLQDHPTLEPFVSDLKKVEDKANALVISSESFNNRFNLPVTNESPSED